MIIYCIKNTINGKQYIGKTVSNLSHRWAAHCGDAQRGSKNPLHSAIRKYGKEFFEIAVITNCSSAEELNDLEKKKIKEFETHVSMNKGYNATWGGDGAEGGEKHPWFGKHHTDEVRELLSELKQGDKNPSYKMAGENHWNRGLIRSEETKRKIREKRALQNMTSRRKLFCKRGHLRTSHSVGTNSTCLLCKKLLRKRPWFA